jgi:hypothetical protein
MNPQVTESQPDDVFPDPAVGLESFDFKRVAESRDGKCPNPRNLGETGEKFPETATRTL